MRALLFGMILGFACAGTRAADVRSAIYDRDPQHLWNRLYIAIATRAADGADYGIDNSEPYGDPVDDPAKVNAILDEFLRANAQTHSHGNLQQALLLNDAWAAFDAAAVGERGPLQHKLARVVGQLRMTSAAIATLPDNYAQAVRSAAFAKDFDPQHPDVAFLPADLFDPKGPWVQVGGGGRGLVAPRHVAQVSGRSGFLVFIRCPGGREATLSYLQTLNLYRTPWELNPAEIATSYPSRESVRWDPLQMNAGTPQFPAGTLVALVRQLIVVNDKLEPVPTPITQSVQFRAYRRIGGSAVERTPANFGNWQSLYDLTMRRRDLLAGRAGGFHAMTPDETEYRLASVPMGVSRKELLVGPVVLSTCPRCHQPDGIFSVNTYTRFLSPGGTTTNPQLLPAESPQYQIEAAVAWKTQQFNWGLLRGLLEADEKEK